MASASQALGDGRGLDPAADPELAEDVGHVRPGGLPADEQALRDLAVRVAPSDEPEHLELARCQSERSGVGDRA
jgi:hypothetical protein